MGWTDEWVTYFELTNLSIKYKIVKILSSHFRLIKCLFSLSIIRSFYTNTRYLLWVAGGRPHEPLHHQPRDRLPDHPRAGPCHRGRPHNLVQPRLQRGEQIHVWADDLDTSTTRS